MTSGLSMRLKRLEGFARPALDERHRIWIITDDDDEAAFRRQIEAEGGDPTIITLDLDAREPTQ